MSADGSGGLCRAALEKGTVSGSRLFLQSSGCGARRGGSAGLLAHPLAPEEPEARGLCRGLALAAPPRPRGLLAAPSALAALAALALISR